MKIPGIGLLRRSILRSGGSCSNVFVRAPRGACLLAENDVLRNKQSAQARNEGFGKTAVVVVAYGNAIPYILEKPHRRYRGGFGSGERIRGDVYRRRRGCRRRSMFQPWNPS